MLEIIWHDYLYQPLFNFLIWLYNNWTGENLGWAIVLLTVFLRIALLPFTLITERNKVKNLELIEEIDSIEKQFRDDPILKKEEIRKILKKRKVQPWAKAVVLGIQGLVLVLLYQVFLRGITGEKLLNILYPSINFPGVINTIFYGFDLASRHNIVFPGVVAIWLFLEIYLNYRKRRYGLTKADLAYFLLFPTAVFLILWWLPLVKALFILTSLIFSLIIGIVSQAIFKTNSSDKKKKNKNEEKNS
ncbi:MAG: hypothetical protein GF349_03445 [Candidatus Magasanikbacteria bacterium]|nr:hypothetical protein [Candidatus Magasanikbacteria bacterium]